MIPHANREQMEAIGEVALNLLKGNIPEHLLQSMETERRLTAPVQLPTLTRLDQDVKQIIESPLPEDQKVLMLDQLL